MQSVIFHAVATVDGCAKTCRAILGKCKLFFFHTAFHQR